MVDPGLLFARERPCLQCLVDVGVFTRGRVAERKAENALTGRRSVALGHNRPNGHNENVVCPDTVRNPSVESSR
jgi:hypothetical protein